MNKINALAKCFCSFLLSLALLLCLTGGAAFTDGGGDGLSLPVTEFWENDIAGWENNELILDDTLAFYLQSLADIGITETNFPDAVFRAYVAGSQIDLNQDGLLSAGEIAAVTEINISNRGIASLQGIEFFTGLIELWCYYNPLKALDITANTALEYLDCDDTKLSVLDLSKNTALKFLDCRNNQLALLDVSNNTNLEWLHCFDNQLTALDITNNTILKFLDCRYNRIASLDDVIGWQEIELVLNDTFRFHPQNTISGEDIAITADNFPDPVFRAYIAGPIIDRDQDGLLSMWETAMISGLNLNGMGCASIQGIEFFTALQWLDCGNNQLTALDMTKNTALTYLSCENNQLTTIDLSSNTELWRLHCFTNKLSALDVSANTKLEYLYCAENQLTALDVSNNAALILLDCRFNNLDSTNDVIGWQKIGLVYNDNFRYYPQNTDIAGTYRADFPDANFREIVLWLLNDRDGGSRTGDSAVSEADKAILAGITSLDVTNRNIISLTGLEYFVGLTSLRCAWNYLNELDVTNNKALKFLYCHGNRLNFLDVSQNTALVELLCYYNPLKTFDVTNNLALEYLDCDDTQLIWLNISKNTELRHLDCRNNQLSSLDVSNNTKLERLYCQVNQLAVFNVSNNAALNYLDCRYNFIASSDYVSGWQENGLALNYTFLFNPQRFYFGEDIAINETNFPDPVFRAYVAAQQIDQNQDGILSVWEIASATHINMDNSGITSLQGIEFFSSLVNLSCWDNQLTELDLSKNIYLEHLDCDGNQLTELDVSNNINLFSLDCRNNQLRALDVSKNIYLEQLNCNNNRLKELDISKNTDLIYLYCNENQLTKLDVSKNTALRYLDCTKNYLSSTNDIIGWQEQGLVLDNTFRFDPQNLNPGTVTYTGAILYQTSPRPAAVTLRDSKGEDITTYTNEIGAYALTIPTPQEGARFTLKVTKPGYLSYTIQNLTPADLADLPMVDIRQLAGDVNGDGIVNAIDLTYLLSEFNRTPAVHGATDIDGNGIVNATDLTYLLAGFNKRAVVVER